MLLQLSFFLLSDIKTILKMYCVLEIIAHTQKCATAYALSDKYLLLYLFYRLNYFMYFISNFKNFFKF